MVHRLDFRLKGKRNIIESRWVVMEKFTNHERAKMGITVKHRLKKKRKRVS